MPTDAWNVAGLPSHLRLTFRVVGDDGATVDEGPDLGALRRRHAAQTRAAVAAVADGVERARGHLVRRDRRRCPAPASSSAPAGR